MQTREFPPEVFARLAPDIYFKRHIENGVRPTGRGLLERRPINVRSGTSSSSGSLKGALGSAVVRAGAATVLCGITGGLTRFSGEGGIYASVEIHRGGMAVNPTGEEQVLSMRVHRLLCAAQIPQKTFEVVPGVDICLTAQIVVLSRTGPSIDLVWESLVAALRDVHIPHFVQDEQTLELVPSDDAEYTLELPDSLSVVHQSFGVLNDTVYADIDGAVEEECILNRVSVSRSNKSITSVSVSAPDGITKTKVLEMVGLNK